MAVHLLPKQETRVRFSYPAPMLKESAYIKIRIAVPVEAAAAVRQTLGQTGAGVQGNYKFCSGSIKQTGRFKPGAGARPAIGKVGRLEEVEEELIEVICHNLPPKSPIHGLLGLNILQYFDLSFKFKSGILEIS